MLVEGQREAFAAVLGDGKDAALLTFIRELRHSLEEHQRSLLTDYQTMLKTIGHVNDILHVQRRYARTLLSFLSQLFKQFGVVFMENVKNLARIHVFLTRF